MVNFRGWKHHTCLCSLKFRGNTYPNVLSNYRYPTSIYKNLYAQIQLAPTLQKRCGISGIDIQFMKRHISTNGL